MKRKFKSLLGWLKPYFYSREEKRHNLVGPPKVWKEKRDYQINFLKGAGLKTSDYLLDLGCGTLRGGIPIINYLETGHYYGFDTRDIVIQEAEKELNENHLEQKKPVLLCKPDINQVQLDTKFDVIWAFSVLFHMTDPILEDCIRFVADHLKPDGVFYANVNLGEHPEGTWRDFGFPIVWRSSDHYDKTAHAHGLTVVDMGDLRTLGNIEKMSEADQIQRMLKFSLR